MEQTRNYGQEIDQLRQELQEIKALLIPASAALKQAEYSESSSATPEKGESSAQPLRKFPIHGDERLCSVLYELIDKSNEKGSCGSVTYVGTYASGGNQSNWIQPSIEVEPLLEQIEDGSAARVLSCIGSNDRLRLLLALLKRPMTVQEMLSACSFNTTGQVYNHLRSLIAVDLVAEDEHRARGTYYIRPHRVSGLIMLLAAIRDLLDDEFTHAEYDE